MKKLFAILLAAMMVLSMTTIAFASDDAPETPGPTGDGEEAGGDGPTYFNASATNNTVTITKTLTAKGPQGVTVNYPGDTLAFTEITDQRSVSGSTTVTKENMPALPAISPVTVNEGDATATINVTLPAFENVGIYTYQIKETDTNVAGVTYRSQAIKLVLTVVEMPDGQKVVAAVHCEAEGATKSDTFENVFNAGSLKVSKQVTGNYGEKDKDFHFTVTFTAPSGDTVNSTITYGDQTIAAGWATTATAKITLSHNESIQFDNIPAGVTYKVVETEANQDGYTTTPTNDEGTIAATTVTEASFENNRTTTPDTGIVLDSLPYILIGAVATAAAVVMIAKKRRVED